MVVPRAPDGHAGLADALVVDRAPLTHPRAYFTICELTLLYAQMTALRGNGAQGGRPLMGHTRYTLLTLVKGLAALEALETVDDGLTLTEFFASF